MKVLMGGLVCLVLYLCASWELAEHYYKHTKTLRGDLIESTICGFGWLLPVFIVILAIVVLTLDDKKSSPKSHKIL